MIIAELLEGNKAMYKPCSKFEGKFEAPKAVFLCNDGLGHPGQFVYIRDDREEQEYFGLCEVEVFAFQSKSSSLGSLINISFLSCQPNSIMLQRIFSIHMIFVYVLY